ncbi:unnamed protein product [Chironomus riparius]|uniref:Peptidase S1 domain-containing protein n=1 Tax=Chironomus riparius TaxID=315576 RepID=A0A9N9WTY5_9DIPT|nr:unnamed protein product [Chironomus riparius]
MDQKVLFILSMFIISAFAESERIAGGGNATLGQFPHHAKVEPSIGSFRRLCGGALIKYNWVITVAQCIQNARDVIVRLGVVDRLIGPEMAIFWVRDRSHIIIHDNFNDDSVNGGGIHNDIGLIFLAEATEGLLDIKNVSVIALPPSSNFDFSNTFGVVTGFGFYEDGDDSLKSMNLRYAVMMVNPIQSCRDHHGPKFTDGNFCTNTTNGQSTCIGDEGGPFFVFDNNNDRTLVGLASTMLPQCTVGHPAIFTNLVFFFDWIMENISNTPTPPTVEPPITTTAAPPDDDKRCNCVCNCFTCPKNSTEDSQPPKTNSFWDE